jgi:uncharacterized membrane protein YfcA
VLVAIAAGLLVGALLGALGAGGSVLTLPVLVFGLGQQVPTAAVTSLLVVGATAAAGVVGHARAGTVRFPTALALSAASAVGSLPGSWLRTRLPPGPFLLAFAALMLVGALVLWRWEVPAERGATRECVLQPDLLGCAKLGAAGIGVGALTGFFGVGGGFVIVPVLLVVLGFRVREAIGTSLVVVAAASGLALAFSSRAAHVDWAVALPFAAAGIAGSFAGRRAGARLPERLLRRGFAVVLALLAVYVAARAR